MMTIGHDIGTRYIKSCVVDDGRIVGWSYREIDTDMLRVLAATSKTARSQAGVMRWKRLPSATTGYGAELVDGALHFSVPQCLAKAALHLDASIRTVIDIGAMFIIATTMNESGKPLDSIENERCAVGGGALIETVAAKIGIGVNALSNHAARAESSYGITSSCAVFVESEVISRINAGHNSADIVAGILGSIASKTSSVLRRLNVVERVACCGGVSKIPAFRAALGRALGRELLVPTVDPQIVVAYGAALLASQR